MLIGQGQLCKKKSFLSFQAYLGTLSMPLQREWSMLLVRSVRTSVTRCWNKKQPGFFPNIVQKQPHQFLLKKCCFSKYPKKLHIYWATFVRIFFKKNGPYPASFSLFLSFQYTVDSKQMVNINKFLPMTGFEPLTSGIGSDRSTN